MRQLVRLLRLPLDGSSATDEPIDRALAEFAIHRHGVGPLLHIAAGMTARDGDVAGRLSLKNCHDENVRRQRAATALLLQIAAAFHSKGIEWLVLKGVPQAKILYPEPAWRASSHLDILVAPGTGPAAAAILQREGWPPADRGAPPWQELARAGLRVERPLTLIDRGSALRINILETLYFARGAIGRILDLGAAFRPRQSRQAADVPHAHLGCAFVLDMLLRGCDRCWSQLKWHVDLELALRNLAPREALLLIESIAERDTVATAVASLLAFRTAFDGQVPAAVAAWLDRQTVTAEIETRRAYYLAALANQRLPSARWVHAAPAKIVAWPIRATRGPILWVKQSAVYGAMRDRYRRYRRAVSNRSRSPRQYQWDPATREDRYPLAFQFARDRLGDAASLRILSFGCSTGEEVFTLRRYFPQAHIKGIDIAPVNIAACERALARSGDPAIGFELGDSTAGEPGEYYDAIFCMAVLRDGGAVHPNAVQDLATIRFGDFERAVRDFARCLRPAGFLFIAHSNFRFSDSRVSAGFDVMLQSEPSRSLQPAGLFDDQDRRLDGVVYRHVGFRKRPLAALAAESRDQDV